MENTILSNKKIHQATVLAYRGKQKVAELSKGGMTCDSPFTIASISKLYTYAMTFALIDKQLLAYELMQFLQAFMRGQLFSKNHLTHPNFRCIQFIPLKYGSGMMQLKIPRILSPFFPTPEIIGHSGSSGSFAFYCPSKNIFITGTINQLQHRPFAAIYRVINKV